MNERYINEYGDIMSPDDKRLNSFKQFSNTNFEDDMSGWDEGSVEDTWLSYCAYYRKKTLEKKK